MSRKSSDAKRVSMLMALQCCRGASAAEFAIVLPLLLLLILGTLQIGMLMYSYNVMVSAARDTARAMAVCTITDLPTAIAQTRKLQPVWIANADWVVTPVIASDVSLTISVTAAKAAILTYIPVNFGSLTTKVVMRKEPLAFGGGSC